MVTETRPKFFTPNEVSLHNTVKDVWVSYLGKVYNLTPLCEEYAGDLLLKPIVASAGKDISHWFDNKTGDVSMLAEPSDPARFSSAYDAPGICDLEILIVGSKPVQQTIRTHIDPTTAICKYYAPHGRFIHVPPPCPASDWANDFGRPWWKDGRYEVGVLSKKTRMIRIINTLTSQEQSIEVCEEENMHEILQRYIKYNAHAASYTWKYDGQLLDMGKTLTENGIEDEDEEFYQLGMDAEVWTSALHLYFNDDLTEA